MEEVNYKGWKLKLGDWVHLSNPDDPSKPIVGQVFKCWTSESDDLMWVIVLTDYFSDNLIFFLELERVNMG